MNATGPTRIQRKRTKGWKMPANTVYVGRGSKWGNPHKVDEFCTPKQAVIDYSLEMMPYRHHGPNSTLAHFYISEAFIDEAQRELRGKHLACWCPLDQPCHADVLLDIANAGAVA